MYTRSPKILHSFGSDERGTVAMMFGIMMTALLFLAGMALDYGRAVNVRSRVLDAADSAALAAGRALMEGSMTATEIQALALRYFNENIKGVNGQATIDTPRIQVDTTTGGVTIDVNSQVNLTLARIMGKQTIDFPISSAVNFSQKDIEIGMALDITGSMGERDSSGARKIDGLKSAFESFAQRLIPESPTALQKVRIAVAPYSYSVNVGGYANSVSDAHASTCVSERKVPSNQYSDATGTFYGVNSNICPGSTIMPLSDDRDALISKVNRFAANGGTAGHLGVQWAWNLVSPNWGGMWGGESAPAAYDEVSNGKVIKAVVLMTDGEFNTKYHGASSPKQAKELCAAMKAEGVVVFSVGFGLGRYAAALDTLRECATPGNGYFADAANASELEAAFNNFADKLTELRLTK